MAVTTGKPLTSRKVSALVKDASGTPLTMTLGPGPGDFKVTGIKQGQKDKVAIYDSGTFYSLVEGQDAVVEFSVTLHAIQPILSASVGRPIDLMAKTNKYSTFTSTDSYGGADTVTLELTVSDSSSTFVLTFAKCELSIDITTSVDGSSIAISGTCYGGITPTIS